MSTVIFDLTLTSTSASLFLIIQRIFALEKILFLKSKKYYKTSTKNVQNPAPIFRILGGYNLSNVIRDSVKRKGEERKDFDLAIHFLCLARIRFFLQPRKSSRFCLKKNHCCHLCNYGGIMPTWLQHAISNNRTIDNKWNTAINLF